MYFIINNNSIPRCIGGKRSLAYTAYRKLGFSIWVKFSRQTAITLKKLFLAFRRTSFWDSRTCSEGKMNLQRTCINSRWTDSSLSPSSSPVQQKWLIWWQGPQSLGSGEPGACYGEHWLALLRPRFCRTYTSPAIWHHPREPEEFYFVQLSKS